MIDRVIRLHCSTLVRRYDMIGRRSDAEYSEHVQLALDPPVFNRHKDRKNDQRKRLISVPFSAL